MNESAVVQKIMKAVRDEYPRAYVRKIADRFTRGLPDLLIVAPRDMVAVSGTGGVTFDFVSRLFNTLTLLVEVKDEGGRVSKIQEAEHEEIRRAGGKVVVATCAAEVITEMRLMGAVP